MANVSKAKFREDTFTHVLMGDVLAAYERAQSDDALVHRREVVRAVFAALEGLHWRLKRHVHDHASAFKSLTPHEHAALLEETYSVDHKGVVRSQPKFLPLDTAIRLVVGIVTRYLPAYTLDFNHVGWKNLKSSIAVRHRLTHPKSIADLTVTDKELSEAMSAFSWLLAFVLEVHHETNEQLKSFNSSKTTV